MRGGPSLAAVPAVVAVVLAAAAVGAEPVPPPTPRAARVTEVWAATSDVWDLATAEERTLVATSGGLVERRGGRVVRVLGVKGGLPGQRVRSVSLVGDEAWVGTVEGLAVVAWSEDGAPRVVRRIDLPRVARVVRFGVGAGDVWIASAGRGLFRLADGGHAPVRVFLGRAADRASPSDLLVRGDELWVATQGDGVLRLSSEGALRGRVPLGAGTAADIVWDLAPDGPLVLVGTAAGLRVIGADGRVDPGDARLASAARLRVSDVRAALPANGATWLATWGGGAFRLDPGARAPAAVTCAGCDRVRALAPDGDAVLVGHDAGLGRVTAGRAQAEVLATGGLPSSDVTALARGLGALWIGTFGHGLARMGERGPEAMARATTRWGMDRRINDLAVTREASGRETLWIATARGLWAHDGLRFWPIESVGSPGQGYVMDLHVDREGALWVASSRSLCRLAAGRWTSWQTVGRYELEKLHAVTTDAHGRVWLGALHGLYVLDPRTGTLWRHSVSSGALPMDWVTALAATSDGVVAGTYSGGLVWFGADGPVTERASGGRGAAAGALPSGWVNPHAIARAGESILVGTPGAGLLVGHRGAWHRLGPREGLPASDVTATLPAGPGELWVATRGGLARVRLGP
jgi:ligand-binding sensor domain-containing protein